MGKTYRRDKTHPNRSRRVNISREPPDVDIRIDLYNEDEVFDIREYYNDSKLHPKEQPDKPKED